MGRDRPIERRALTIRAALLLGFGLIAGIWIFAWQYFNGRIAASEAQAAAVSARYLAAQDLLAAARGKVLAASVVVRDALLDPAPKSTRDYAAELAAAYDVAEWSLRQYVPVLDMPGEQERVDRLREEIAGLRRDTNQVLALSNLRLDEAGVMLRSRVLPKREAVIGVAEELQSLNRNAFVQHQTQLAGIYRLTQIKVWQTLGFALAASLAVGLFATIYSGRLERRIRLQSAEDVRNRRDLERLSASVVTAQEEERRAIARELHDEVGQVLTAIKVELAVAERTLESGDRSSHVLGDVRSITERAIHTVRDLSNLLRPPLLDDLGLPEALDWYLKTFRRRHDMRVDVVIDPLLPAISAEADLAAYRIVQEALNNVAKHSGASHCRVMLRTDPGGVVLSVEDNGVGFNPAELYRPNGRRGLGLLGIRERVAQLGGTLTLDSAPGKGTRLTVTMPLSEPATDTDAVSAPVFQSAS